MASHPLSITAAALLLTGCSLPETNLSHFSDPDPENVSCLLVDQSISLESSPVVFLDKVDGASVKERGSRLFLMDSGRHTLIFAARDFQDDDDGVRHALDVTTETGRYYQILPVRTNDKVTFQLQEIDKSKTDEVLRGENIVRAVHYIGFFFD